MNLMTNPIPMGRKMKPTIANSQISLWITKKATGADATKNKQAIIVKIGEFPD